MLPLLLLAASPAAFARDPSLPGFYVGGGIGQARVQFEDDRSRADFEADDFGFKFIAGYRFIDWVAVEANYADYGTPHDRIFGVDLEAGYTAFSASILGMLPLKDWDLFARLGISRMDADFRAPRLGVSNSDHSNEPMFGFGAQYRIDNLQLRAEIESILLDDGIDDDDDDWDDAWETRDSDWVHMLSVGVTYKF